jgi:hypothetical protein
MESFPGWDCERLAATESNHRRRVFLLQWALGGKPAIITSEFCS